LQEEIKSLSFEPREVVTSEGKFPYDYVLIASGSETNFYGMPISAIMPIKVDGASDVVRSCGR